MATAGGDETARRTPGPRLLTIASAALLASLVATHGAAAQDYPTKDVRMIVPWGAGGGTDGIVRKVSTLAEKERGGTIYRSAGRRVGKEGVRTCSTRWSRYH